MELVGLSSTVIIKIAVCLDYFYSVLLHVCVPLLASLTIPKHWILLY